MVTAQHAEELGTWQTAHGVRGLGIIFFSYVYRTFGAHKLVHFVPLGVQADQLTLTLKLSFGGKALHWQGEGVPGLSTRTETKRLLVQTESCMVRSTQTTLTLFHLVSVETSFEGRLRLYYFSESSASEIQILINMTAKPP